MPRDNRHICSPYGGKDCKFFKRTGKDEEIGGKKLSDYSIYCLAGARPRKIKGIADFTGLTPKWCPKLKEDENE